MNVYTMTPTHLDLRTWDLRRPRTLLLRAFCSYSAVEGSISRPERPFSVFRAFGGAPYESDAGGPAVPSGPGAMCIDVFSDLVLICSREQFDTLPFWANCTIVAACSPSSVPVLPRVDWPCPAYTSGSCCADAQMPVPAPL